MNCTNLNTAAEILEAFRACNNPGEEIELFECLATRPDPPVGEFVEILRSIKLEAVLALTIQAFGKITDVDIKARLKESQDLLTILSQQAQSGSSDLIRWSAATTIDNLGFDFILVSQYLTEEPKKISEKIVQSKLKRFADRNLLHSNDYDEFVRFWLYGNYEKLREVTLGIEFWDLYYTWLKTQETPGNKDENFNKFDVCWKVIQSLGLKGIKEVNAALERAEAMGDNASELDENELFEGIGQTQASVYGKDYVIDTNILCLQSNNPKTRNTIAANTLQFEGKNLLDKLRENNPTIGIAMIAFANPPNSVNYSYNQLTELADNLELLKQNLRRKKVRQDCQIWYNLILKELNAKQTKFDASKNQSFALLALREKLDRQLNQIRDINRELYEQVIARFSFDNVPQVSIENDKYEEVFNMYKLSLKEKTLLLNSEIKEFYKKCRLSQLALIQPEIKKSDKSWMQTKIIAKIVGICVGLSLVLILPNILISLLTGWSWLGVLTGQLVLTFILADFLNKFYQKINHFIYNSFKNLSQKQIKNKLLDLSEFNCQIQNQEKHILNLLSSLDKDFQK